MLGNKIRVFLVILIGLISIFTIQTLIEIAILYFNPSISAAYYTPIVTNFFIYIIPVIISLVSYLKFRITNNRKF